MASTEQRKIQIIADGKKVNSSLQEMQASSRLLYNQLRKLPEGSDDFVRKSKELKKVNERINGVKDQIRGTDSAMKKMVGSLKPIGAAFAAAFSFQAIKSAFTTIIKVNKDFEKSLSTLSSITGAVGEDLEFYSEAAKEIGRTTSLSASQAVDAFKLIGSARPELLKDKEALASVTAEAVALSEAAGIDLPASAQSLAGALNQFKLPAEDASRVINALAAGSKEGAAAIPEITEAIDKFGPIAQSFNVSLEESVGLVETLAESNIKGAEAGTKLRNVLNSMAAVEALPPMAIEQMEKYGINIATVSDKTIPLNERLAEFSKISDDATALTKVFGKENMVAGQIILQNVDKFSKYTEAVTGTNVAYEQQATNTDNLQGSIDRFNSSVEGLILSFNGDGGLTKAIRAVVDGVGWMIDMLATANQSVDEIKQKVQTSEMAAAIARDKNEVNELAAAYLRSGVAVDEYAAKQEAATDLIAQYSSLLETTTDQERTESLQKQIKGLQDYQAELKTAMVTEKQQNQQKKQSSEINTELSEKEVAEEKKKNERLAALRAEYQESRQATDLALKELRIAAIQDETERELAEIDLKHEQELLKIQEQEAKLLENNAITEEQKQAQLAMFREQEMLLEQERDAKKAEKLAAEREKEKAGEMAHLEEKQQMQLLKLEEGFLKVNTAEQNEYEARLQLEREFAAEKLRLLEKQGKLETAEAQELKNEILRIDKEQKEQEKQNEEDLKNFKAKMRSMGVDVLQDGLAMTADILGQDEDMRRKHGKKIKALQIANVTIDGVREVAAIWKNYNASPMNILVPGSGAILAAAQTGLAIARTGAAISQIRSQQFAEGGGTGKGKMIDMMYNAATGQYSWSGGKVKDVGTFAYGGNVNSASTGLIGEKGAEWVAPNWMMKSPAYADTIGWLESERQRKGMKAFAVGGATAATVPSTPTASMRNPQANQMQNEMMSLRKDFARLANEISRWPRELRVVNSVQDQMSKIRQFNEIEEESRISRSA